MLTCHRKYSTLVLHSISTLYSILYSPVLNQLSLYSCSLSAFISISAWPEPMQGINAQSPCHWIQSVSTPAGLNPCPASVLPLCPFPSGLDWTPYQSRPGLDSISHSHLCGFTVSNLIHISCSIHLWLWLHALAPVLLQHLLRKQVQ